MESLWEVIESGSLSVAAVMAKDAALLAAIDPEDPCTLHFYDWDLPCLTYGYFIDPALHLNLDVLQSYGWQAARRPTGGGILFHVSDLPFSVLIPARHPSFSLNPLDNYAFINQRVAEAVAHFALPSPVPQLLITPPFSSSKECSPFCMATPSQYDLMIQGKKVGGAAQRRTKQGFLHQASLSLLFPRTDILVKVLRNHKSVLKGMKEQTYCLLNEEASIKELQKGRVKLKALLKTHLTQRERHLG